MSRASLDDEGNWMNEGPMSDLSEARERTAHLIKDSDVHPQNRADVRLILDALEAAERENAALRAEVERLQERERRVQDAITELHKALNGVIRALVEPVAEP